MKVQELPPLDQSPQHALVAKAINERQWRFVSYLVEPLRCAQAVESADWLEDEE